MNRRRPILTALLLALTFPLLGCDVSHLEFSHVVGFRLESPADSAGVRLPFVIRWTSPSPHDQFLVLFDRTPMRSGQSLLSLVPTSDPCRQQAGCPSAAWLANEYMYVTDRPELVVSSLPDYRSSSHVRDKHILTIIRLDAGKRLDEAGLTDVFFVDRGA
jgi:hypothetical protein